MVPQMAVWPQALPISLWLWSTATAPASPAGRHPAPPTPLTVSAALLRIYVHSQAYFALEERKPVSLSHIALRGHVYCSLFIGSIKENVSSWGLHRGRRDLGHFVVIKLKPALFWRVFAVGCVVPPVQPTVMIRYWEQIVSLQGSLWTNNILREVKSFQWKIYWSLKLLFPSSIIGKSFQVHKKNRW